MKRIVLFTIIGSFLSLTVFSQNSNKGQSTPHNARTLAKSILNIVTPGGYLDSVFDRFGNRYSLLDLSINDHFRNPSDGIPPQLIMANCNSGYFQLYMEPGCGLEDNSAAAQARLQVVCQVLHDLSSFINSPCGNTNQKVNIWVRNINNLSGVPPGNVLGLATGFYNIPALTTLSGIVDNAVWTTLHSGADAYTNISYPLYSLGALNNSSGTFFHGMMAFNFSGTYNWHTDLSTVPVAGELDLYTVVLHEMTHALGFTSLITSVGTSALTYPYYSRYDQYLKSSTGSPLITNTGSCNLYNYSFTAATSLLTPNPSSCIANQTTCATAIKFDDGNMSQPVYTPNCWESGSSLSHFEDECPITARNDIYFVMSNATVPTTMKRHYKMEERQALCDIGYNVNTTFGNSVNLNDTNYGGSVCTGINVGGINDGLQNGNYLYYTMGTTPITISGPAVTQGILSNDYNADSISCLQVVMGYGILSATNANNTTNVTFTPLVGSSGLQLLRYIPVNKASGKLGNITYVYVYIDLAATTCESKPCDLVKNGSFESATDCGDFSHTSVIPHNPVIDCWYAYFNTPDLYTRGCPNSFNTGWIDCNIPTTETVPPTDSHNNSASINNHFIGMGGWKGIFPGQLFNSESAQSVLTSGLINGASYKLSFWSKVCSAYPAYYVIDVPTEIQFLMSPGHQPPTTSPSYPVPSFLVPIKDTLLTADDHWHSYTTYFTYSGATGDDNLIVQNAVYLNPAWYPANYWTYILVDDIKLEPMNDAGSFAGMPTTLTTCDTLFDLSQYATVPGGTFSGAGVFMTGSTYNFSALQSVLQTGYGPQTISYSYTDPLGCDKQIDAQINVVNPNINFIITPSPSSPVCRGTTVTLTASGASNYVWPANQGLSCTSCAAPTVFVTDTATFVVESVPATGCIAVALLTVKTFPIIPITASATPNTISSGQTTNLSASGANSYIWTPSVNCSNPACSLATAMPTSTTIYQVIGTDSNGCKDTAAVTVSITTGISTIANGRNDYSFYPNPAQNDLTILRNRNSAPAIMEVYEVSGKKVMEQNLNFDQDKVNIHLNLAAGIYIVHVSNNDGERFIQRLVICK
ncbi:MAG: T9SS type A sorting domain-containing protein [Bacteroidota bacterium]